MCIETRNVWHKSWVILVTADQIRANTEWHWDARSHVLLPDLKFGVKYVASI